MIDIETFCKEVIKPLVSIRFPDVKDLVSTYPIDCELFVKEVEKIINGRVSLTFNVNKSIMHIWAVRNKGIDKVIVGVLGATICNIAMNYDLCDPKISPEFVAKDILSQLNL